jgi:hypothetical protein
MPLKLVENKLLTSYDRYFGSTEQDNKQQMNVKKNITGRILFCSCLGFAIKPMPGNRFGKGGIKGNPKDQNKCGYQ